MEKNQHFLLLSYPAQGHLNPVFQLAKQLARGGACVTFATTVDGLNRIRSFPTHPRLSYASFSDGKYERRRSRDEEGEDIHSVMARMRKVGVISLADLIRSLSENGRPVTMLIYSMFLSWAADVARDFNILSAFFFSQSATTFAIYQNYFKIGFTTSEISIELPGLPLFSSCDVPSFILPNDPFHSLMPYIKEHFQVLEEDPDSLLLINTFDSLENESILAIDHARMIPVGPLNPSAFSDETETSDRSYGIDLCEESNDYLPWLDSKPSKSVIYISFGSLATLKRKQFEELLNGLIDCNRPFLWVSSNSDEEVKTMVEEEMKKASAGLMVQWCRQVEVLSHKAVGCFLTHCGWNSTTESLTAGVPMVACPQFSDQTTNAKMVEEVWKVGVKAKADEEMVVERGEIKRCLEIVMENGERAEEVRRNVGEWSQLALTAVKDGGSSHGNLQQLLPKA